MVEDALVGLLALELAGVGRDDDQEHPPSELGPEPPRNFVAVDIGQSNVEQGHVRLENPGSLDGTMPVEGNRDLVAMAPQKPGGTLGDVLVIIDNEHSMLARSLARSSPLEMSLPAR